MSEYKPGTVAVATVNNDVGVRVSRYDGGWVLLDDPDAFYNDGGSAALVTDIRPLVVLDLDGYAANELASWLDGTDAHMSIGDRLRVAREIRHQTKPARIPEPGVGSIVSAALSGSSDTRPSPRVRLPQGWARLDATGSAINTFDWNDLIDPTLVREGLE